MAPLRIAFSRNSGPTVLGGIAKQPEIGQCLRVFLDDGREIRTSVVLEVSELSGTVFVKTQRSTYQLRRVA